MPHVPLVVVVGVRFIGERTTNFHILEQKLVRAIGEMKISWKRERVFVVWT